MGPHGRRREPRSRRRHRDRVRCSVPDRRSRHRTHLGDRARRRRRTGDRDRSRQGRRCADRVYRRPSRRLGCRHARPGRRRAEDIRPLARGRRPLGRLPLRRRLLRRRGPTRRDLRRRCLRRRRGLRGRRRRRGRGLRGRRLHPCGVRRSRRRRGLRLGGGDIRRRGRRLRRRGVGGRSGLRRCIGGGSRGGSRAGRRGRAVRRARIRGRRGRVGRDRIGRRRGGSGCCAVPRSGLGGRRSCGVGCGSGCRCRRDDREERDRVEIPVRIGGEPDAEVDVGPVDLGRARRADGSDRIAFGDGVSLPDRARAEMRQRDREPVVRADRDRDAARGERARVRDGAARGGEHGHAGVRTDVDAAMRASRVRMRRVIREPLDDRTVDRPRPRAGGRHSDDQEQEQQNEPTHARSPLSLSV